MLIYVYDNFRNIKNELFNIARDLDYLKEDSIGAEDIKFDVSFIDSTNSKFGDVATNIALTLAKKVGKVSKRDRRGDYKRN